MDFYKHFEVRNGYKFMPRIGPERWEELRQFPLRPEDIFIVTFPKSGTTWMQQIVKLLRNGGQPNEVKLDRAIPWLEMLDSEYGTMLGYTSDILTSNDLLSPRAFKCHCLYELVPGGLPHTSHAKYIYVMRNPKDMCVSLWYHVNNTLQFDKRVSWEDHVRDFLSEETPFFGWFYHVLGWWKHNDAPNILFLKYEDMKTDPLTAIRSIAQFIGIENMTDELLQNVVKYSSFASMKQDSSANRNWQAGPGKMFYRADMFIRKGEIGGWREHFS